MRGSGAWPGGSGGFLVLGQSPSGPLLDDGKSSWLDQVPDPAPAPVASSAVPRPAATEIMAFGDSARASQGGVYRGEVYTEAPSVNAAIAYGQGAACSDCGGSASLACPTCSPTGRVHNGFLSGNAAGLESLTEYGPIAGCQELLEPMTHESWLYRPFSAGWFMGFMQGNELVENWVGQEQGFFGGYRFGWDVDPYWGWETRFGFASVALYDSNLAVAAQEAEDLANGFTEDDLWFHRFDKRRDSGIRVWDVEMLWYPFGDSTVRPYFLLGLGSARVDFMDRLSERRIKSVLAMPIALGFKYRLQEWLAVRVEATDNFIAGAGSGFKNLHNFSLTAGMEVRFGGTRTGYWPYYPGRRYW